MKKIKSNLKMNEVRLIIEERKIEIWRFLKEMKKVLKFIIFDFLWMAMIITVIFCCGMVNNANYFIDFIAGKPLYLKVMGNMILIPIMVCFVFWIINICIGLYMRFIANRMNESELERAGIISSVKTSKRNINVRKKIGN